MIPVGMATKQLEAYGVTFNVVSYENDPYFVHLEGHMRGNDFFAFVLKNYVEPNSVFIDVGANCGVTSALADRLLNLQIVAIEPSRVFNCLKKTLEANGISTAQTLNCCIGDRVGMTLFADAPDSNDPHPAKSLIDAVLPKTGARDDVAALTVAIAVRPS